ncbi:LOG family protein [Candidatus Woesearchaeota archaeon]|nr:LOG family protein [Candidatus Woesearchaeota archaeon]
MDETLAENIRKEKGIPVIGVIGASSPDDKYDERIGIEVGHMLREFIGKKGGSIFTGGVSGVGIDTYIGVLRFCFETAGKGDKVLDDNFFVLIPEHGTKTYNDHGGGEDAEGKYMPPKKYFDLAVGSRNGKLDIVRVGNDMAERRAYVSEIADVVVAINGGEGTIDEACHVLDAGKHVICMAEYGGAAAALFKYKHGLLDISLEEEINKDLIIGVESVYEMVSELQGVLR